MAAESVHLGLDAAAWASFARLLKLLLVEPLETGSAVVAEVVDRRSFVEQSHSLTDGMDSAVDCRSGPMSGLLPADRLHCV